MSADFLIDYKVYPSRFAVLSAFCGANSFNAIIWISFANIINIVREYWETSDVAINLLAQMFMICYVPSTLLALYISQKYGLGRAIVVGNVLNFVSAWMRYLATFPTNRGFGYTILLIGQFLAAVAHPIFTNSPAFVAGQWFDSQGRDLATAVASLANVIGTALGSAAPNFLVKTKDHIPNFLLAQAIIITVVAGITLYLPSRPPTPPSASAAMHQKREIHGSLIGGTDDDARESLLTVGSLSVETDGISSDSQHGAKSADKVSFVKKGPLAEESEIRKLLANYRTLLANRNFLFLMLGFGVGLGVFNAFLTLIAQIWRPCSGVEEGQQDSTPAIASGVLLGTGMVAAVGAGIILKITRAYVPMLRICMVLALCGTVFLFSSLRKGAEPTIIASCTILGVVLVPLLPIALQNAAECTYPISEDASSGMLVSLGNIVAAIMTFTIKALISTRASQECSTIFTPSSGVIISLFIFSATMMFLFKKDYRRLKADVTSPLEPNK